MMRVVYAPVAYFAVQPSALRVVRIRRRSVYDLPRSVPFRVILIRMRAETAHLPPSRLMYRSPINSPSLTAHKIG